MGRAIKQGLEYFPFDIDFFQDIKIRKLIRYQGGKAITVYTLLLCIIYREWVLTQSGMKSCHLLSQTLSWLR